MAADGHRAPIRTSGRLVQLPRDVAYSTLSVLLVFDIKTRIEEDLKHTKTRDDGPVLVNMVCYLDANGRPDPTSVCHAARLDLRNLINGLPISLHDLGPMSDTVFRLVERYGDVFRITSESSGVLSTMTQTVVVDMSEGRARYRARVEHPYGRSEIKEASADCRPSFYPRPTSRDDARTPR